VFTTSLGTPFEPRNINRRFDRLCAASGVRRIRFHDLRHSCASLLWSQGVPLAQIQDILGHEDPVRRRRSTSTWRRTCSGKPWTSSGSCLSRSASDVGVNYGDHTSPGKGETPGRPIGDLGFCWCARRDSNPQPSDP
jgi:Phage integrase family